MIHVDINPDVIWTLYWVATGLVCWWLWLLIYRLEDIISGRTTIHVVRLPYFYKLWILPRLDSCLYIWQLGFFQLWWHTKHRYRRSR